MANWQDVTSYSQSHPRGTVEPKSWELAGSSPRIVVTRHLGAPGWYLRTEGLDLVHLGEDLERAKAEAVRLVRERLTRMLDSLPPSDPWRPIETAPRDGTEVALLFAREETVTFGVLSTWPRVRAAFFTGSDWSLPYYANNPPIGWAPLPAPPAAESPTAEEHP